MKEISLRTKRVIIIYIWCVLTIGIIVYVGIRLPQPTHYWHYIEGYYPRLAGGYGGAPDGEYNILISFISETDRVVGSAYPRSSPGQLHGYWNYAEGLSLDQGMYKVWLKDNVIVLAEETEW